MFFFLHLKKVLAMYDKKEIISCLFGLVGWYQTDNPDFPQLTNNLLQSDSGRFFQDEHPLVQIEYIDQSFKNYDAIKYPDYVGLTVYLINQVITFNDVDYVSLQNANQGNQPDTSPLFWEVLNSLSKKLTRIVESSADEVVTQLFVKKKLHELTKSIFENIQIFDGAGSINDKITKTDRFVGFIIEPKKYRNLKAVLESIGTQFTENNPTMKIYVWHTSQEEPINILSVDYDKSLSFQWHDFNKFSLPYFSETHDVGGFYMIGYYEEDLIGQAINKNYSFTNSPTCTRCNKNYYYWSQWHDFVRILPFSISKNDLTGIGPNDPGGAKLFDIEDISYHSAENFGLNLDLTMKCDVSSFICQQRDLFADALRKEVAFRILNELKFNTRNNSIAKEVSQQALYEMNVKENPTGFYTKHSKTMKALDFDMSDLKDACLPCNDSHGITTRKV